MYPTYHQETNFSAVTLNMGPDTATDWHRDGKNKLYGVCAICPVGSFDHRRTGHFILYEPKLIVELMPGDVFFLPSAAITHKNGVAPLLHSEIRRSVVFYSAGGLDRYIRCGHQVLKSLEPKLRRKIVRTEASDRRQRGLKLFLTKDQLEHWLETGRDTCWMDDAINYMSYLKKSGISYDGELLPKLTALDPEFGFRCVA